jgi:demethylmenaquinone methyltransferase/2-methoxy-6-polyprenyl-1,4-benzoquinol methylase
MSQDKMTHFGYQAIPTSEKTDRVASVFHSVAPRYDIMNDLMSLGLHRLWKRVAIARAAVQKGHYVLDLAAGTGDLSALLAEKVGETGQVTFSDINKSMLARGRQRLIDEGVIGLQYVLSNAETLPFKDNHFHCVTMAFGLRNVTQQEAALAEISRVLKPGGRAVILEFSTPNSKLLSTLYDAYSFSVLPLLGKWVSGDEKSYRYLAESIRMHPNQETLKAMMLNQGFDRVDYQNLQGGIIAIHTGFKF